MENTSEYKRLVEQLRLNSNEVGAIKYSRFVRFTFKELTYFLNQNFNLNDIAITLSRDLGINVRYHSLWVAYTRALKKNNSIINIEENKENVITKEENQKIITDNKQAVIESKKSEEIIEEEFDDDYSWLKDPELGFDHLDHPVMIEVLKDYQLTIDDLREIKVDGIKHKLKCLDLITALGEKRKEERISEIYFGKK